MGDRIGITGLIRLELGIVARDPTPFAATLSVWSCESGDDGGAAMATAPGLEHLPAVELLSKVRCSRPSDLVLARAPK